MSNTEGGDKPTIDPERLEAGFAEGGSVSVEVGKDGKVSDPKTNADPGQGMDFDREGGVERTGLDKGKKPDTEEPDEEDQPTEETEEEAPEEKDKAEAPEDLGDWNPDDEEGAKKFDERYFVETDGAQSLNMDAFSAEVAANLAKEDGKAELNAGTYGWLKDRMGVSKEYVDDIIAGQVALKQQNEDAFYKVVGGKDLYAQKLDWAKGVYTDAQKQRFNDAVAKGGADAQEALELLNTRFEKANGGTTEPAKRPGIGVKRPSSPQRTTSTAQTPAGNGGFEPFANADEHRKAMRDAERSGDKAQVAHVRKRLAASTFWR